jgi:hypothetical protein
MKREKHIREVWGYIKNPNMKAFDVPTPQDLIQKPKGTEVNMRKGSGTNVKISQR